MLHSYREWGHSLQVIVDYVTVLNNLFPLNFVLVLLLKWNLSSFLSVEAQRTEICSILRLIAIHVIQTFFMPTSQRREKKNCETKTKGRNFSHENRSV